MTGKTRSKGEPGCLHHPYQNSTFLVVHTETFSYRDGALELVSSGVVLTPGVFTDSER